MLEWSGIINENCSSVLIMMSAHDNDLLLEVFITATFWTPVIGISHHNNPWHFYSSVFFIKTNLWYSRVTIVRVLRSPPPDSSPGSTLVRPRFRPLVRPLVFPLVHPLVRPLVCCLVFPLVRPLVFPLVRPLVCRLVFPLVRPLVRFISGPFRF